MKFASVIKHASEVLTKIGIGGSAKDPKLSRLDFGILEVAMMVSALDGEMLKTEVEAFQRMLKKCRGYGAKSGKEALERALARAGYIMAMVKSGLFSEDALLKTFVAEAEKALPSGFAAGDLRDVRRAFVTWVAMGVSDGDYSDVERSAIGRLKKRFAEMKVDRNLSDMAAWSMVDSSYRPLVGTISVRGSTRQVKLLEDDFLIRAELAVKDLGVESKRAKAEAELTRLIQDGAIF